MIRRVLLALTATLGLGLAGIALGYLSPSLFRASHDPEPSRQAVEASRDLFLAAQQQAIQDRIIYPYSVVPGGVRDASELKRAAQRDPVVAAHYAGFDYDHARVVRLVLARTAYISYRIGNKIYWTRRRIRLKKGETLLTDGKITARTRCANRVEELPQQATSREEPPAAKFEEPIRPNMGTAMHAPPVPFESALLNRNPVPGLGPAPPLTLYDPIGGGLGWTPVLPPPLPTVCGVGGKKPKGGTIIVTKNGKKKRIDICRNGGGSEVPEPNTMLLIGSGLAAMALMVRRRYVCA